MRRHHPRFIDSDVMSQRTRIPVLCDLRDSSSVLYCSSSVPLTHDRVQDLSLDCEIRYSLIHWIGFFVPARPSFRKA